VAVENPKATVLATIQRREPGRLPNVSQRMVEHEKTHTQQTDAVDTTIRTTRTGRSDHHYYPDN